MSITLQVIKHVLWLLMMLAVAFVLVSGAAHNAEHLFVATLTFALMVPLVGSAAVELKRDWLSYQQQHDHSF